LLKKDRVTLIVRKRPK